ncbi:glycosyltransferase [Roseicella aquatilis]|uniref:Glycosyltransferase n=1 Tax=Roseicella aquatilis TaxID=2527868 RepID=A0A4R4DK64_9PROT|nr:glycosyltransferase [Roseicella aquatilis]TCZ60943.1 glycosyltransferase [Roseicella aquatilis]
MTPLLRHLKRAWRGAWRRMPPGLLPLRIRLAILLGRLLRASPPGRYDPEDRENYGAWLATHHRLRQADRDAIRAHVAALPARPLLSVALPVGAAVPPAALRAAIASVAAQLWPEWELCVALDAEAPPALREVVTEGPRIRVSHLAAAAPVALAEAALGMARGEFVLLLAPEGRLAEEALVELAAAAAADPRVAVFYADEDRIDAAGRRHAAWLKPEFDPDLLLAQDLFGGFAAYGRGLLRGLGGLRPEMGEAARHDLALRAAAAVGAERVRHIPAILVHDGGTAPSDPAAHRRAAESALAAAGLAARVESAPLAPQWSRILRPVPEPAPLVSIIVPTRDRAGLLAACAEGVLHRTDYPAIEFIVVDNGSEEAETLALFERLRADPRVRILPAPGPFNYSTLNNRAAAAARGEVLLLLNNDIEVIGPGWLREMVSQAVRPEVGAVGAKLLYADGRLQHGGVVTGVGGVADHYLLRAAREDPGDHGSLALVRGAGAVTAACLALRRSVYAEVGGLDERNLAVAFNDVDLCMKIRAAGYRILWTPFAELYHLESASRGQDLSPEKARRFAGEVSYIRTRWGEAMYRDPFYNPWLSLEGAHGVLSHEPRRKRPWAPHLPPRMGWWRRAVPGRRLPAAAPAAPPHPR